MRPVGFKAFMLMILIISMATLPVSLAGSLELGVISFPMFIPIKGYISEAGFPISLRNLDFNFFKFAGISTSLTLYNIQGLGVTGLPTDAPIIGPCYTLSGNLCLKLILPIDNFHIAAKGGGFAFFNLSPTLMTGNLDRAIASDNGWDTASAEMGFQNNLGFGYVFGGSLTLYFEQELAGIFLEVLYYDGEAPLNLEGRVTATKDGEVEADGNPIAYPNAKIDFSGIEIILGITIIL